MIGGGALTEYGFETWQAERIYQGGGGEARPSGTVSCMSAEAWHGGRRGAGLATRRKGLPCFVSSAVFRAGNICPSYCPWAAARIEVS